MEFNFVGLLRIRTFLGARRAWELACDINRPKRKKPQPAAPAVARRRCMAAWHAVLTMAFFKSTKWRYLCTVTVTHALFKVLVHMYELIPNNHHLTDNNNADNNKPWKRMRVKRRQSTGRETTQKVLNNAFLVLLRRRVDNAGGFVEAIQHHPDITTCNAKRQPHGRKVAIHCHAVPSIDGLSQHMP